MPSQTLTASGTFTVPAGVTSLTVDQAGAQGTSSTEAGGLGGRVQAALTVTPGEALQVNVATTASFRTVATDIRRAPYGLADRLLVAGNGGGGGGGAGSAGAGGGTTGGTGTSSPSGAGGGLGGTQTAGGAGGVGVGVGGVAGDPGTAGAGGLTNGSGGSGGAGLWGGGGGGYATDNVTFFDGAGGGGGSSTAGGGTHTQGYRAGNGYVVLTWGSPPPPRDRFEVAWTATPWDTDPYWVDATPWLLGIGRERGRQPRDTVNRATKLTARLDNRDGRFTMQNGPALNLAAEAGSAGWFSPSGGTVTLHGGWLAATQGGAAGTLTVQSPGYFTGIVAGTTYQVRALGVASTTARSYQVAVLWYNAASSIVGTDGSAFMVETAGVPLLASFIAPAGAVKVTMQVSWSSVASGESHQLTLVALAASTTPLPPYWPNVEPRRPCRWRTDFGGTTYDRFEGLLESLPTAWTDFADEQATFAAAGRLAALADADLPGSVWEKNTLSPATWYKLDEPEAASTFYDSGSASNVATLRGSPGGMGAASKTTGAPMIPGGARRLESGTWLEPTTSPVAGSGNWTIHIVALLNVVFPNNGLNFQDAASVITETRYNTPLIETGSAGGADLRLTLNNSYFPLTGEWRVNLRVESLLSAYAKVQYDYLTASGTPKRPDWMGETWVGITLQRLSGGLAMWINGELVGSVAISGSYATAPLRFGSASLGPDTSPVTFDEILTWSYALFTGDPATLDSAARTPWAGDRPTARFDRFPTLVGIPAARMTHGSLFADAGATLARTHLGGKALTYLHRLAKSARGRILDTPTGTIELRTGGDLLNRRTSLATFGQQSGDLAYESISTDPSFDRIITTARAKNVEGTVQETVATDLVPGTATSYVTRYGRRGPTEGEIGDLLLADDRQAKDFTSWLVNAGKRPDVALDPLVLHPLGDDAVTVQALTRDIDDVVTVRKKHPTQSQTVTTVCRIAGINETAQRSRRGWSWVVTWRLEPLDPTPYILADGTHLTDGTEIAY